MMERWILSIELFMLLILKFSLCYFYLLQENDGSKTINKILNIASNRICGLSPTYSFELAKTQIQSTIDFSKVTISRSRSLSWNINWMSTRCTYCRCCMLSLWMIKHITITLLGWVECPKLNDYIIFQNS
jgi:hypothetical protein